MEPEVCTGVEFQVELSSQVVEPEVGTGVEFLVKLSSQVVKAEELEHAD